jgi:hypothetical protein
VANIDIDTSVDHWTLVRLLSDNACMPLWVWLEQIVRGVLSPRVCCKTLKERLQRLSESSPMMWRVSFLLMMGLRHGAFLAFEG